MKSVSLNIYEVSGPFNKYLGQLRTRVYFAIWHEERPPTRTVRGAVRDGILDWQIPGGFT